MTSNTSFKFGCPKCGQHISASDDMIGTEAVCPGCNEPLTVPKRPVRTALGAGFAESFNMDDAEDLGVAKAVSETVTQFKSLDYGFLLPFKKIFSTAILRKRAVRWVCFFGLAPIAIYLVAVQWDLEFMQTAWLLQLYFCCFGHSIFTA